MTFLTVNEGHWDVPGGAAAVGGGRSFTALEHEYCDEEGPSRRIPAATRYEFPTTKTAIGTYQSSTQHGKYCEGTPPTVLGKGSRAMI